MKKIVLKLGAASLAVLPVVAVASCSTTTPNLAINTEVSRFEKLFMANESSKQMTTVEAKESINNAPNQDEKWNALNKLTQLPAKDSNFAYTVMDATIDKNVDSWLIVTMEITETTTRANAEVLKFVIADLKPVDTALDNEVARFNISSPANEESKVMKTSLVITNINNAKNSAEKLAILEKITNVPKISQDFTMEILFAKPTSEPTSIDVMISITEKASGNSQNANFKITGLTALTGQEKLEQQASLLTSRETLFPDGKITAFEAQKIITNTTIFNKYYSPVLMAPGVKYEFRGASINTKINTTLDVSLVVSGEVKATTPILKTIQLTNFLSLEDKLNEQADYLVDKQTLFPDGPTTALKAKAIITDRPTLDKYYPPIVMEAGITYEYVSTAIDANASILNVTLKVVDQFGQSVTRTIKLTGFLTPQEELKFISNKLENLKITGELAKQTAQMAAGTIKSTEELSKYYPTVVLGDGFGYTWKSTEVVGDTVKVTVSVVSSTEGTIPVDKDIILSGFVSPLDYEVNKFNVSVNATDTNIKTIVAIRKINEAQDNEAKLAAINSLVNNQFPSISSDFELIIGEASRAQIATSVNIALTIKQKSDNVEKAATFTIANLTAETNDEELRRIADEKLVSKPVLADKENETAKTAADKIKTTEILATYYETVPLLKGMKYTLKADSAMAIGDTVKVTVIVTSDLPDTTPYEKEITITNFISPLNFEAKRFAISRDALDSSLKTSTTARELNDKASSVDKLAFIKTLVADFPEIAKGFTLTVGKAIQNPTIATAINITLTIAQESVSRTEAAPTSKDVTFTIANLTSETPQAELIRLADSLLDNRDVLALKATETSVQAAAAISSNSTLDDYYARTVLGTGITYTYSTKAIVGDTLNVTVNVTSDITGDFVYEKTFTISGFRTLLEAEKLKFTKSVDATNSSTKTTQVIRAINKAQGNDAKVAAIGTFVNGFPALSNDTFTYTFGTAIRAGAELNSVEIQITIAQKTTPGKSVTATFTITNLTAQTDQEEFNAQLDLFTDKTMTGELAKQTAAQAAQALTDNPSLFENYYPRPEGLLPEITYILDYAGDISGSDEVSVTITVSSSIAGIEEKSATFKLLGFTSELNFEKEKFSKSVNALSTAPKMQTALRSVNTPTELQAKVSAIKLLTDGFPELSTNKFDYVIGEAVAVGGSIRAKTIMNIPITITNRVNRTSSAVTFVITGLVAQTLEEELQSIADTYFADKDAIFADGVKELAVIASPKITNPTSLETYYPITLPTGFAYEYVSNVVEGNNIRVTVKVKNTADASVPAINAHTFLITNFKPRSTPVEHAAVALAVSKAKTAADVKTTRDAIRKIKDATTDKVAALIAIVSDFPSTEGVTLTIGTPVVSTKNPNWVNIPITIAANPASTREGDLIVTFTITGLQEETLQQELKRIATTHLKDKPVLTGKDGETAAEAKNLINNSTLDQYYARVTTLPKGITYNWVSNKVIGNDVEVTVNVVDSTNNNETIQDTFLITNFPTALEALIKKLNVSQSANETTITKKATTNQVIRGLNDDGAEHPGTNWDLIVLHIKELVNTTEYQFPITSSTEFDAQFTVVIAPATLGSIATTVDIPFTITDKTTNETMEATYTITKLVAETPQQELDRLAKSFKDSNVLSDKGTEIAAQAAAAINSIDTLKLYYNAEIRPQIYGNVTFTFKSTQTIGDSVKIFAELKNTTDNLTAPVEFSITKFKTPKTLLEKEAAKLAVSIAAKETLALTTRQAIRSFMEATGGASEKLTALKALVALDTFPKVDETKFSLSIINGSINGSTDTSIDVHITIQALPATGAKTGETTPPAATSMNVILTITGLTAETPQEELKRLADTLLNDRKVLDSKAEQTAVQAAAAISNNSTLDDYYTRTSLGKDITYTYSTNAVAGDTLNVTVDVTSTSTGDFVYKRTFNISGFRTLVLETEKIKFTKSVSAKNTATKTTEVLRAINKAQGNDAKVVAIGKFVEGFPALSNETFTYIFGTAIRKADQLNSIEIPITIAQNTNSNDTVTAIFTITNLTAQTNQEELDEQAKLFVDKAMDGDLAKQTAEQAVSALNANRELLESYYPRPAGLLTEISYTFTSASVINGTNNVLIKISVSSSETGTTPVIKTFTLSNFTSKLDAEKAKFNKEVPALDATTKMQAALRSVNTPTELQAKVNAIKTLTNGFPELLEDQFNYVIGDAVEAVGSTGAKTSMSIPITITNRTNRTSSAVNFVITELTAETAQEELDNIVKLFDNKKVSDGKNTETAAIAAKKINAQNLHEYYSPIPEMPEGIRYEFVSASVIPNKDIVKISINILSTNASLQVKGRLFNITGFKPATPLETEAVKLWTSEAATNGKTSTSNVITAINTTAKDQPSKLTALKSFVTNFPTIDESLYTLEIGEATVDQNDPTSVNVPITVSKKAAAPLVGEEAEQPVNVIFTITGLTSQPAE